MIVCMESGVSFSHYRGARRFCRVASCDRSTIPGLLGNTRSAVFCLHVWLFGGYPIWRVSYFDPAASLLKHRVLHYRIRTASRTSAVFIERIHKKAIQAFKCFRWVLNGTNQCTGHFHLIPGRGQTTGRLSIGSSESLLTSAALGAYELNKPNVNGFTTAANC